MPRTLSAPTAAATGRRDADVIRLLEIQLTAPSATTLRFSDAYRDEIGQTWLPMVASWGTIDEAMNTTDVGGRPNTVTFSLFNTKRVEGKSRISSLIRTSGNTSGTYEFTFAKVIVRELLFPGGALADAVNIGVFYIEDQPTIDARLVEFRASDPFLMLDPKMRIRPLTNDAFPLADPDDIGKDIPVAIGVLKDIPCLGCVTGWRSSSATAITATSPGVGQWLTVSDDRAPTTGVGQVDDEQLRWNAKRTTSAGLHQVRVGARGINDTTAAPHAAGAALFQILSGVRAYGYLVCENVGAYRLASGSVTNVRVNGVLQTNVTIDYNNTTLVAGRSFVVIWFRALPVLKKQVTLAVDDTTDVSDTIAVSSPSVTTVKVAGERGASWKRALSNRAGSPTNPTWRTGVLVEDNFPDPSGTVDTVIYSGVVSIGYVPAVEYKLQIGNPPTLWKHEKTSPTGDHAFQFGAPGPLRAVKAFLEWKTASEVDTEMRILATAEATGPVVVNRSGAASKTGQVDLSGNSTADVVVGGQVTCDVVGVRDDSSGTITGTASAVIRYPADVTKFMLLALFGVVAADLGTSWATTRTTHRNGNYLWDFMLTKHRLSDLRRKVGEQSRSALCFEGGLWELRLLRTATSSVADITLDYESDVWGGAPVTVSRTPSADLRNSITVYAGRDYRKTGDLGDRYRITRVIEDLSTFSDRLTYDLELDFVQSVTTATTMGTIWRNFWRRQRIVVECVAFWNALAAEKFDVLAITNHPVLDDMAPSGAYRIIEKSYLLADAKNPARIALKAIEVNP